MTEYKVDRESLNEIGQKIYDELIKVNDDDDFIHSVFLLIKQDISREKLLEFLQTNKNLNRDDVMLKAIHNSQRLALFHTI